MVDGDDIWALADGKSLGALMPRLHGAGVRLRNAGVRDDFLSMQGRPGAGI